jgi:hypothetical protein
MSETDEQWADRMLALCEGYKAPVSHFQTGQLLTAIKSGRRAVVAVSCPVYTVLSFGTNRSYTLTTDHVIKHYQPV